MADNQACPTCGHIHPGGKGAAYCLCNDCALLWTTIPEHLLSNDSRARLEALRNDRR